MRLYAAAVLVLLLAAGARTHAGLGEVAGSVLGPPAGRAGVSRAVVPAEPPTDYRADVQPDEAAWWTGTVQLDNLTGNYSRGDNTVYIEHQYLPPNTDKTRHGWLKFNTTVIPDVAIIDSARIAYLVMYRELSVYVSFTQLTADPVGTGSEELFDLITDGASCGDDRLGLVQDTTELNATGLAHIAATLGQDWTAFGVCGTNLGGIIQRRAWIAGWNNAPRSDAPHLIVDYHYAGAVAEKNLDVGPVDFAPSANPVRPGPVEFRWSQATEGSARLTVYSAAGERVDEQSLTPGVRSARLDLAAAAPGVYVAVLRSAARALSERLVVR